MALLTTTIGAYPKPDYVPIPDWFREGGTGLSNPTEAYQKYLINLPNNIDEILERGTQEVVKDQMNVGVDIPTDGEIRRENYIHYHCRHIEGIDFSNLTPKTSRQGAWVANLPTVTGPLKARDHLLPRDYRIAQAATDRLQAALKHIDADRLIAAPDCGLGFLDRELALAKLTNMVSAAKSVSD